MALRFKEAESEKLRFNIMKFSITLLFVSAVKCAGAQKHYHSRF